MSASGDQVIVGVNSSRQLIACRGSISTVLAPGDRLAIVNQDPADATLADLSITLKGTR